MSLVLNNELCGWGMKMVWVALDHLVTYFSMLLGFILLSLKLLAIA